PWFEGVAVFGETAADPKTDPEVVSPVLSVVYNLWDTPLMDAEEIEKYKADRGTAMSSRMTKAEDLYSQAFAKKAYYRLRAYFDNERDITKYWPGYFAVRAVIASWRETLGRRLSGAQAYRMLIHVTRYTEYSELLPDIRRPIDAFRDDAAGLHAK